MARARATFAAASAVPAQEGARAAVRAKPLVRGSGTYRNVDYGYRVRLPEGVFQPYTPISTNVLFFEAGMPDDSGWCTKEIWYYEHPLPEDHKYSKTKPLEFEEFRPLLKWWDDRRETERAWKVPFLEILRGLEEQARPHWDVAREARQEADLLADRIKEIEHQATPGQTEIEELRAHLALLPKARRVFKVRAISGRVLGDDEELFDTRGHQPLCLAQDIGGGTGHHIATQFRDNAKRAAIVATF